MPIYEYRCSNCKKKVEIFILRMQDATDLVCPGCGGKEMKRLISRFASPKSDEARLESLTDPHNLSGLDENDPASMARWIKRMGKEMGEDVSSDEIDQMADEIASGNLDDGPAGSPDTGTGSADSGDLI